MDSEHKNKKIGLYPKSLRPFFNDFMRCQRFSYIHAEGISPAIAIKSYSFRRSNKIYIPLSKRRPCRPTPALLQNWTIFLSQGVEGEGGGGGTAWCSPRNVKSTTHYTQLRHYSRSRAVTPLALLTFLGLTFELITVLIKYSLCTTQKLIRKPIHIYMCIYINPIYIIYIYMK